MAKPNIWVVTHGEQWAVRREGVDDPLGVHPTQEAAISAARGVARAEEVELIIQGSDGEIRQKDSYGNDPRGIPG